MSAIENSQDYKSELVISGAGNLVKFSEKGRSEIMFNYDSSTGLLTSRADSTAGVCDKVKKTIVKFLIYNLNSRDVNCVYIFKKLKFCLNLIFKL